MSITAMKQALEALETADEVGFWELQKTAITVLRAAIEQAEKQGPVAWLYWDSWGTMKLSQIMPPPVGAFPVYTAPPAAQRQWVGLTDEEIIDVLHPLVMADMPDEATDYEIARAIEAKLKEKNT
jgi:hypothetical protein